MVEQKKYPDDDYDAVSLRQLAASLKRQRAKIFLSVLVVIFLLSILFSVAYLLTPSRRIASVSFRLDFQGAEQRLYPSGVPFSTGDIVASPVLRQVYEQNQLERFSSFSDFSSSIFIVSENYELQALTEEYRNRLADSNLATVDRERLEREFEAKMESMSRGSFTINFASKVSTLQIPRPLVQKILRDILEVWAEYAAVEKGALRYQIPVLSSNVLPSVEGEPIIVLDMLRSRIWDLVRNIQQLRGIPGVEALRTEDGLTLVELEIRLHDVLRIYVRPLVNEFKAGHHISDRQESIRFIQSQLDHTRTLKQDAEARVDALRGALALYTEGSRPAGVAITSGERSTAGGETVMPQLSDSFLQRIVDLAGQSVDREYRQDLVDRIINTSMVLIPYDVEIEFYEELLSDLRSISASPESPDDRPDVILQEARSRVVHTVEQVRQIYELASEHLNASRTIYTVSGPVAFSVVRSVSVLRLVLICLILFLISIPAILVAVLVIDRAQPSPVE